METFIELIKDKQAKIEAKEWYDKNVYQNDIVLASNHSNVLIDIKAEKTLMTEYTLFSASLITNGYQGKSLEDLVKTNEFEKIIKSKLLLSDEEYKAYFINLENCVDRINYAYMKKEASAQVITQTKMQVILWVVFCIHKNLITKLPNIISFVEKKLVN